MKLTPDQQKVVDTRKKDILVSAAAGSGKTAVLIQRILSRITEDKHPVDVDRMLIVTFTNAAASEMRQRLHKAITERLSLDPSDENLQRQASLIHNAQITTIDSFCLFLIRNHFHEIDLDPGFRIADPGEIKLIEKQVLKSTLEEFYEEADPAFLKFADVYCPDGKDEKLEKLVEELYHYSMSHPWPLEWIGECKKQMQDLDEESVFESFWMQYGWEYMHTVFADGRELADMVLAMCNQAGGPYMYADAIESDRELFNRFCEMTSESLTTERYESLRLAVRQADFEKLRSKTDPCVTKEAREAAQAKREQYKKLYAEMKEKLLGDSAKGIVKKQSKSDHMNRVLLEITERYILRISEAKREKDLIDFSDAEHFALDILCRNGQITDTARRYREYFEEIMIDEYQDSNLVQELLLASIARDAKGEHNRFMVGDMKQSIYRFRLACPRLFLEKFHEYHEESSEHVLIHLKKNFRSRTQVLDSVNAVFERIMQPQVGDVAYDEDAALYLGADYPMAAEDKDTYGTQLCLLEKGELKANDARRAEAVLIAKRIKEMVGSMKLSDRTVSYRDIVILTRKEKDIVPTLHEVLTGEGIPVHITSKRGYFDAIEVATLMELLGCINNPYEDISFGSTMLAMFFGFTEEELGYIRAEKKEAASLYECFRFVCGTESASPDALKEKVERAVSELDFLRREAVVRTMPELVELILFRYHYLEYVTAMPAGQQRRANIEMFLQKTVDFEKTSFHGLFQFIRYMKQLKKYDVDFGEASALAESADVVRIMTIHKSKGLEFPVCFVAGLGGKINQQELSDEALLDADWGVASNYVSAAGQVSGSTLKKQLLAKKMKRDSLGEELRVLYVAMTRAREKLILTGTVPDLEKALEQYAFLNGRGVAEVPTALLTSCGTLLDYLLIAYQAGANALQLMEYKLEDLGQAFLEEIVSTHEKYHAVKRRELFEAGVESSSGNTAFAEFFRQLSEKLNYRYGYENLAGLHAKTSVSELKRAAMEEAGLHPQFETEKTDKPYYPAFIEETQKAGGTMRGSAYHRVLELLDFAAYGRLNEETDKDKKELIRQLESDMERFEKEGLLTAEDRELVRPDDIADFLLTDCAAEMAKAQEKGLLKKEQPFVLSIEAQRLKSDYPKEETVLIQGIIDVFYEKDDKIVILDYKTDRTESLEQLLARYRIQLDYYEEAVQRITGKEVKEKVLYSFCHKDTVSWK